MQKNSQNFSKQELNVIRELRNHTSYKDIGRKLSISVKTVEYYVKNLKEKTGVNDKESLLKYFDKLFGSEIVVSVKEVRASWNYIIMAIAVFVVTLFFVIYRNDEKNACNFNNTTQGLLDRHDIVRKIDKILRSWDDISKVVIIGNGGAGKTTVARRILEQSDAKIKFELNAESEKTLLNSFLELGECLSVTKDQKLELDIIRNVQDAEYQKRRLVRFVANLLKKSNNWFLLFDNAQSVNSIQKFLPINKSIWGCGKVLITTRNQNVVDNSLIKSDQIVDIGKLSEFEKRNLFSIIVYDCKFPELSSSDQSEISKFLQMIPDFPLDICAAAYYIKNTKISLDDYATLMKKNIKELSKEQKELLSENVNYNTTRYSIVCSMLKELTEKSKKFQYLLAIICLMDSQSIPKNILRKTIGSIEADHFIRKLKEHSFAVDSGNEISIHRSNHEIGLSFSLENMKSEELVDCVHLLVDELREEKQLKMVPHMESVLTKISKMKMQKDLAQDEAVLLIAISDIIRRQTHHMNDALVNLQKAIELSSQPGFFDNHVKAIAHLKMGEIYTIINQNNDAYYHLQSSLQYFAVASQNKVQNLRLLGIVQMRKHKFNEANQCFSEALKILQGINMNEIYKKLSISNIYEDMAFNYFMNGINRKNARLAVPLMEKAVAILDDPNAKNIEEIVSRQAVHKMKLAGIHNALANYQKALDISNETEDLIEKSGIDNCDIFYVKGLIARERGLAYLRLNRIFKSYEYFKEAKEIFTKLMKGDYLFKLKNHEAEILVRVKKFKEALDICETAFQETDRERNNYSDLFFNTCYYHAAVAAYNLEDFELSRKYFQKFSELMKSLCKDILDEEVYAALLKDDVFNANSEDIHSYFEKSVQIFEAIYWKGYEFTEYYVKLNAKIAK